MKQTPFALLYCLYENTVMITEIITAMENNCCYTSKCTTNELTKNVHSNTLDGHQSMIQWLLKVVTKPKYKTKS